MTGRRVSCALAVIAGLAARSWIVTALCWPAAWTAAAYFWSLAPCWRCKGGKTNPGSGKRRFGLCERVGGASGPLQHHPAALRIPPRPPAVDGPVHRDGDLSV